MKGSMYFLAIELKRETQIV